MTDKPGLISGVAQAFRDHGLTAALTALIGGSLTLAAAVTPIMKLLVAVVTLNGIRITWSMATTLNAPDPMPSRPDKTPATIIMKNPGITPWTA